MARCVDYFRIQTSKIDKFGLVKDLGPHIGRNELGGSVSVDDDDDEDDFDEDGHSSDQGGLDSLHPVQVQGGCLRVLPRDRQDLSGLVQGGGDTI